MRRDAMILTVLLGSAPGCLQLVGESPDGGASAIADAAGGGADAADVQQGTGCVVDSISGLTLCTSIALCPGVAVDHDVYPDCGFRAPGASIEVDCVCGDFLCPIGTALDCNQLVRLLAMQSEAITCTQVAEGRCAPRGPVVRDAGSCDKNCLSTCAGDPGCIRLCGC